MPISKASTRAASIAAVLWLSCALAADPSPSRPGDDALTCEQIYAQVDGEVQRTQRERDQRAEELRAQGQAGKVLLTTALLARGLGGTAQAAQMAVEAGANKTMGLSAPPPNPRMEYLKQLWAQRHCVKK